MVDACLFSVNKEHDNINTVQKIASIKGGTDRNIVGY